MLRAFFKEGAEDLLEPLKIQGVQFRSVEAGEIDVTGKQEDAL